METNTYQDAGGALGAGGGGGAGGRQGGRREGKGKREQQLSTYTPSCKHVHTCGNNQVLQYLRRRED